jgi:hypothetical protein
MIQTAGKLVTTNNPSFFSRLGFTQRQCDVTRQHADMPFNSVVLHRGVLVNMALTIYTRGRLTNTAVCDFTDGRAELHAGCWL